MNRWGCKYLPHKTKNGGFVIYKKNTDKKEKWNTIVTLYLTSSNVE